jgi:hypothetical protein
MPITGRGVIAYVGVNAPYPPNMQTYNRVPTTRDSQNFTLGDFWLVKNSHIAANENLYYLASLADGIAIWVLIAAGGHGTVIGLSGNAGTNPVFANGAGIINIVGDATTINVTGDGVSTLTVSAINSTQSFLGDAATGSTPAVPLAGVIEVFSGIAAGGVADNLVTHTPGTGNQILIALKNSINQPNTNNTGTTGMYQLNSVNFMHNFGGANSANTWLGAAAGNLTLTTAVDNTGIGALSLATITTGTNNVAVGASSGTVLTTGSNNTLIGYDAGGYITTGSSNTIVGDAPTMITTGSNNLLLGISGSAYTAGESSNILLSNNGVASESNTIRIGTQGSSAGQQNRAFCAGINGVTPANPSPVPVVVDSAGQLGTAGFYSTGSFTPSLTIGGSAVGITYSVQAGKYVVLGNVVFITVEIILTSKGSNSGNLVVTGIPFNSWGTTHPTIDLLGGTSGGITLDAGYTYFHGLVVATTNNILMIEDNTSGGNAAIMQNTNISNTAGWNFSGFYWTS